MVLRLLICGLLAVYVMFYVETVNQFEQAVPRGLQGGDARVVLQSYSPFTFPPRAVPNTERLLPTTFSPDHQTLNIDVHVRQPCSDESQHHREAGWRDKGYQQRKQAIFFSPIPHQPQNARPRINPSDFVFPPNNALHVTIFPSKQ